MASTSVKSNLKSTDASKRSSETGRTLRWAADVIDNEGVAKKAKPESIPKKTTPTPDASSSDSKIKAPPLCSFCGKNPACVRMKASWRGKRKKQSMCLLHYYTTSAFHAPEHAAILDAALVEAQLKGEDTVHKKNKLNVQDLFAEAFVQLQQELAQESLNISVGPNDTTKKTSARRPSLPKEQDPLAIIHDLGRSSKKRKAPSMASNKPAQKKPQGGFLKSVPVPERLRKTQEQQAKWQREQINRMNKVAKAGQIKTLAYKKRDTTRRSIWSTVIDGGGKKDNSDGKQTTITNHFKPSPQKKSPINNTYHEIDLTVDDVTCSCGSTNVIDLGNVTSRNDVRKGEIWGSADRSDEVVVRYRCNQCGKTWQETD